MSSIMYDYICETPAVLKRIIERREEICRPVLTALAGAEIRQVYIIGSGTSFHAGLSAQPFIEELTGWQVIPLYPTHFIREVRVADPHSLVIGVSQGGQSLSTAAGLQAAVRRGLRSVAVSANEGALIFQNADASVPLEVGEEHCGAKTKGYCGSVTTLMLLAIAMAAQRDLADPNEIAEYIARMERVIANMPAVIGEAAGWYERIDADVRAARRIIVVGYGGVYGDVLEGALKILETIRQGVSGYEMEEFFHGIYNSISETSHLFVLAPASGDDSKSRAQRLLEILGAWTPHTHLIASPEGVEGGTERDLLVPFIEDPLFSCWEYILPLQIVACQAACRLGIDPAIPKDPRFHQRIGSKAL